MAEYSGFWKQQVGSHFVGAQTHVGGWGFEGSSQAFSPSCAAGVHLVFNMEQKKGPGTSWARSQIIGSLDGGVEMKRVESILVEMRRCVKEGQC